MSITINRLYWWHCPNCHEENKVAWDECFKCGKKQKAEKPKKVFDTKGDDYVAKKEKKDRDRSLLKDSAKIINRIKNK